MAFFLVVRRIILLTLDSGSKVTAAANKCGGFMMDIGR